MSEWWKRWRDWLGSVRGAARETPATPAEARQPQSASADVCVRVRRGDHFQAIAFWLVKDADGYPPDEVEFLWCEPLPGGTHYRIDNVPFYAKGVAVNDVVKTQKGAVRNYFTGVVTPGGHSTIRVIFHDRSKIAELRAKLSRIGVHGEEGPVDILHAFDVPPTVVLSEVQKLLQEGEDAELWTYQEACLGQ